MVVKEAGIKVWGGGGGGVGEEWKEEEGEGVMWGLPYPHIISPYRIHG